MVTSQLLNMGGNNTTGNVCFFALKTNMQRSRLILSILPPEVSIYVIDFLGVAYRMHTTRFTDHSMPNEFAIAVFLHS
jgi:hypothetical protein